ncbi:thiamine pyrophosphate-dependent dehydrogenase E1 component subunit alpha [Consotaella aegiceratis]|uniref:thiamine pyrophosphate-dependent dehydrogenase E1 component subunit alpha n=1 Tax=Consotaella aegiceratis TaxID=3097961 RepID=UPI002F3F6DC3
MALTKQEKQTLYRNLVRAMALDTMMMRLIRAGKIVGFYHEGGISLAPGAAAGAFLRKDDGMWAHYRAHGIAHMLSKGVDVRRYVAEHMGREAGCCRGRSSFHSSFPDDHIFGASGNIGANFPACTGNAFAAKYKGQGQIVMNCSGDGSYQEGRAYEAMHMASTWQLPIVFWCENNAIAQHSALRDIFPVTDIAPIAASVGIKTMSADGQDVFACGEAAKEAVEHARSGNGPIFVELKVLRGQEHNVGGLNYESDKPRSRDLMKTWKEERNPLAVATAKVLEEKLFSQADVERIKGEAQEEVEEIELFCEQSPRATPPVEDLLAGVYAPATNPERQQQ